MERRSDKRVQYRSEVNVEGFGGELAKASRICDLSVSGAFIEAFTVAPEGTRLHLEFAIGESRVQGTAEVRYSVPQIGMGVRFLDLGDEERKAIEALVGASRGA
jgi:hypothetical protein